VSPSRFFHDILLLLMSKTVSSRCGTPFFGRTQRSAFDRSPPFISDDGLILSSSFFQVL